LTKTATVAGPAPEDRRRGLRRFRRPVAGCQPDAGRPARNAARLAGSGRGVPGRLGSGAVDPCLTELLKSKLVGTRVHRFLWASAFRLGQGQSEGYRKGCWLLCGDAAHAMGPSAGAGMMVGVLGAWRLGWRLALAAKGDPRAEELLAGYEREQPRRRSSMPTPGSFVTWRSVTLRLRRCAPWRSAGCSTSGP
jgi:hypothetical protein